MRSRERVESMMLRATLALPEGVLRRLAGPAVVIDGQTLSTEVQLMLRLQRLTRIPAVEALPLAAGRRELDHQSRLTGGRLPIGAVRDVPVDGVPARLYTPRDLGPDGGALPLLLFFHGGGFVFGGLDSHDPTCRLLAERAGVRVLALDYRLAPEHPFPAAYDDALAACRWVLKNAESLGADPARIAVGGDSAGGTLAAAVAVAAAREGLPLAFQLLVYPAVDSDQRDTRSYHLFRHGFFLTEEFMDLATRSYLPDPADRSDPRASPLLDVVPEDLAPALVVTAGFDPLRDEGEAYARKLAAAGVSVELRRFSDQIHGFFNMVGVGRRGPAVVAEIAVHLKTALHG